MWSIYILPSPHIPASTTVTPTEQYLSVAKTIQTKNLDPNEKCCYPSKRCENPRVFKSNGELHRFCHEHRARANLNQRWLEERRREEQLRTESQQLPQAHVQISLDAYMAQLDQHYGISDEQARRFDLAPSQHPSDLLVNLNMDEDDLRMLAAVLSVDDKETME